jgi:hypothetical protein
MSGGRDERQVQTETPPQPALTPYANAPTTSTIPAGMPGQLQALAGQLSAGYGGGASPFLESLNYYHPMRQVQYQEPISVTQEAMKSGKHQRISSGNPTLDAMLNPVNLATAATRATGGSTTGNPSVPATTKSRGPSRLPGWDNR